MKRLIGTAFALTFAAAAVAVPFSPGNILVSEGDYSVFNPRTVSEYTRTGVFVQRIVIPKPAFQDITEQNRDMEVDANGDLHVFNGTFTPVISTLRMSTGLWTDRTVDKLSISNGGNGKLAVFGKYLFITDEDLLDEDTCGIIRYDLLAESWIRFGIPASAMDAPIDLFIAPDGFLYALTGPGSPSGTGIDIYDPASLAFIRRIDLSHIAWGGPGGGAANSVAVGEDGTIFLNELYGPIYRLNQAGEILSYRQYTHGPIVQDMDLSVDGLIMVVGTEGQVTMIDPKTLLEIRHFYAVNYYGADSYCAFVPGVAPMDFTVEPAKSEVAGQNSVKISVVLATPTPQVLTAALSDNSSLISTPASVAIGANKFSGSFFATVQAVNTDLPVIVRARIGNLTRSCVIVLKALVPTAMALTPNPAPGGQVVAGRVVLNGIAGSSGRVVSISDNSSYCVSPGNISVPPGSASGNFELTTLPVVAQTNVTVRAAVSAGQKTVTLRIIP